MDGHVRDRRYAFDFFNTLNDRLKPHLNKNDSRIIIRPDELATLIGIIEAQPIFCVDRRDYFPNGFAIYNVNDKESVSKGTPLVVMTDTMLGYCAVDTLHRIAQKERNLGLADRLDLHTRSTYFTPNGDPKYNHGFRMLNPVL